MESIWHAVLGSTVTSLAILGLLSLAVYLGRSWVGERIARSIGHGFDVKLEQFKNEISETTEQRIELQSAANAVMLTTHQVTAEWRIKAVDDLWREVLRVRDATANPLTMLDILLPSEYQRFVTDSDFRNSIPKLGDNMHILNSSIEHVRPLVGDNLFNMFFLYRATLGRIWALLEKGIREGHVKPWFKDKSIRWNLRQILSAEQMGVFESRTEMHLIWTRSQMEDRILAALREILVGTQAATVGMEQASRIRDAVDSIRFEAEQQAIGRDTTN